MSYFQCSATFLLAVYCGGFFFCGQCSGLCCRYTMGFCCFRFLKCVPNVPYSLHSRLKLLLGYVCERCCRWICLVVYWCVCVCVQVRSCLRATCAARRFPLKVVWRCTCACTPAPNPSNVRTAISVSARPDIAKHTCCATWGTALRAGSPGTPLKAMSLPRIHRGSRLRPPLPNHCLLWASCIVRVLTRTSTSTAAQSWQDSTTQTCCSKASWDRLSFQLPCQVICICVHCIYCALHNYSPLSYFVFCKSFFICTSFGKLSSLLQAILCTFMKYNPSSVRFSCNTTKCRKQY